MTVYGVWRCSTDHQDQERQVLALKEAGCLPENIYGDKITGVSDFSNRPQLQKCLALMKANDILIISAMSFFDVIETQSLKAGYRPEQLLPMTADHLQKDMIS